MKLASLRDGSRDGQLAVVSRDLRTAQFASGVAGSLQRVLDDWNFFAPQLQDLYEALNAGRARHAFPFDPARAEAPLPRAFQWVSPDADGALCHAASDRFLGATEAPVAPDGASVTAQLAVVAGDLPAGVPADAAIDAARLVMLSAQWRLPAPVSIRGVTLPARRHDAFAPVAVTLDELGGAWKRGKLQLPLTVSRNGKVIGRPDVAAAMRLGFPTLIAMLAQAGRIGAGAIVGSGALAGLARDAGDDHAIALEAGERIRLEMLDTEGRSVFGAIDHALVDTAATIGADTADATA